MSSYVTISRNGGSHQGNRPLSFLIAFAAMAVGLFAPLDSLVPASHAAAITSCNGCHGYGAPIGTYADSAARNTPNGQFPGSHNTHVMQYAYICSKCHTAPATETTADNAHQTGLIQMASPINSNTGAYYQSATTTAWSKTNNPSFNKCTNVYCHSDGTAVATGVVTTNVSPLWGTIASGCTTCHSTGPGYPNLKHSATFSTNAVGGWANPGNAAGSDGALATYNTSSMGWLLAKDFHWVTSDVAAGDVVNGITVVVEGWGSSGTAANRLLNVGLTKNGTVGAIIGTIALQLSTIDGEVAVGGPTNKWGGTWVNTDLWTSNFSVAIQRANPTVAPISVDNVKVIVFTDKSPKMNSHPSHASKTCDTCHSATVSSNTTISNYTNHNDGNYDLSAGGGNIFTYSFSSNGGSCASVSCHGPAQWGVSNFDCVGCHNVTQTIGAGPLAGGTRRAVSGEFMSSWSHTRSKGRVVTKWDCVVCHMEGDPATGSQMGSYHGNGYVELRDPDTGVTIQNVVWVSFPGAGNGWYTSTGTPLNTLAQFVRNLSTNTLEAGVVAIQFNMCLKCHDGDGALSTLARNGGAATSALRPFNVALTGLTTLGNPNGDGNVVNVRYSFITSNASYHPVMGRGNNSYAQGVRMAAPWNMTKAIGTTTQWGNLLSCWDCHSSPGDSGIQTHSVTAHGSPATVRGPIRGETIGSTATTNLCFVCHAGPYTGSSNHQAGTVVGTSAFQVGGSSMGGSMKTCHYCHGVGIGVSSVSVAGSATLTEALARPLRAQDVHGFNDRYPQTAGSRWDSTNRPYAFIRNVLISWRPARSPETTTNTTGICYSIVGRTCDDNMSNRTYSPGGAY